MDFLSSLSNDIGHDGIAQLLLKNGADVYLQTNGGSTLLYAACFKGRDGIAQLLLKNGRNVRKKIISIAIFKTVYFAILFIHLELLIVFVDLWKNQISLGRLLFEDQLIKSNNH